MTRPEVRAMATGLGSALLAVAAIGVHLGLASHRLHEQQDRATAVAPGVVVRDDIGDEGDVRVRWRDDDGRQHEQQFGIYDTDRYREGAAFEVRYDPTAPGSRAFPGDPEETSAVDDLEVPIGIAAAIALLLALIWAWRWTRYAWRGRRPGERAEALALAGEDAYGGVISSGALPWLALREPGGTETSTWQRVMWHPDLATLGEAAPVSVHGDRSGRRAVVVELATGTRLVPIGRLRHREPGRYLLAPRADVALEDEELFVLPAGTTLPPPHPWWRRPLLLAGVGGAVGAPMALLLAGSSTALLPFILGVAAFLVNLWALAGAEP